ncbi:MAG TPA: zinc ribbon domain-containing protein [Pyrinomonadaceae bacterium]|jgi:hypothetical protein|nr:zinc ribbon domain-containing protein [Pyrinomonadaceae bacterium]
MFCPQCGQQQAPGTVRFCSRCGFPLDGVLQLLANGGVLPVYRDPEPKEISPRKKGVKQGGLLFLSGALIVPVLAVFASYINSPFPEILAILAALICFLGGPLRMLYAGIFEEGAPRPVLHARPFVSPPMSTPHFGPPVHNPALQPPPAQSSLGWRQRPITAELANPPSVTENTTRLLDKDDRSGNQ